MANCKSKEKNRKSDCWILSKVFSYLDDVQDLGRCLLVNKFWNSIVSKSFLWEKFVKKEFGQFFDEDGNGECNWFEVYKNFHQLIIQDDSWMNIDDLEESVSCPFCQTELFAVEEDSDYLVNCPCNYHFRMNVFTDKQVDRANRNFAQRYDNFN